MTPEQRLIASIFIAGVGAWNGTQYQALFYVIIVSTGLSNEGWYTATLIFLVAQYINGLLRAAWSSGR